MINDAEIRISGIEALNKKLGTAAALRFLTCSIASQPITPKSLGVSLKDKLSMKYSSAPKNNGKDDLQAMC